MIGNTLKMKVFRVTAFLAGPAERGGVGCGCIGGTHGGHDCSGPDNTKRINLSDVSNVNKLQGDCVP
jgi:hypothetical protein